MPVLTTFEAFRSAIETGEVSDVHVVFESDAVHLAEQALAESKTLLLGECHGVAENPAIIRSLVGRFDIDLVALEWPVELSGVVDHFANTRELVDDQLLWLGDGRVTAEHFLALRALVHDGVKIALFDRGYAPPLSWSERDRALADTALAVMAARQRVLVVAGNAHTPLADTQHGTPMGAWIAKARPGVREIVIRYGSGNLFNFGKQTFPDRFGKEPAARLCVSDRGADFRLPRASMASVAYRPETLTTTLG